MQKFEIGDRIRATMGDRELTPEFCERILGIEREHPLEIEGAVHRTHKAELFEIRKVVFAVAISLQRGLKLESAERGREHMVVNMIP
jgi:hypothetical protein